MISSKQEWRADLNDIKARIQHLVKIGETIPDDMRTDYRQKIYELQSMLGVLEQETKGSESANEPVNPTHELYADMRAAIDRAMARFGSPD